MHIATNAVHPLAHLPFVRMTTAGVDLWNVPEIESWGAATALGRGYAQVLLESSGDNHLHVYWVVREIMDRKAVGGVEAGFLQALAGYAIAGFSQQASPA